MLSKTADTKPSPCATSHDASGSFCTGIIEAASTSDSKNIDPRKAPGSSSQCGRRSGTHSSSAIHTAAPMNGKRSDHALNLTLTTTLTTIAVIRIAATMKTRTPSIRMPPLLERGRNAENHQRDRGRDVRLEDGQRRHAVDPHHRRRRVADDAARAARIRCRDDRGEIADVYL